MARQARILGSVLDAFGDEWSVREWRDTEHSFRLAMGWPRWEKRGKGGCGGPRAIITHQLLQYLESYRHKPSEINLPIGQSTVKRLRRILGHHWRMDREEWWNDRWEDLLNLTVGEFAEKHDVSTGAASKWATYFYGPALRTAGWWREDPAKSLLEGNAPRSYVAEKLDISIGSVGRLRWKLRQE